MFLKHKIKRAAYRTIIGLFMFACFKLIPDSVVCKLRARISKRIHRIYVILQVNNEGGWYTRNQIRGFERSNYFIKKGKLNTADYLQILVSLTVLLFLLLPLSLFLFCLFMRTPNVLKIKQHKLEQCSGEGDHYWEDFYVKKNKKPYSLSSVIDSGDNILILIMKFNEDTKKKRSALNILLDKNIIKSHGTGLMIKSSSGGGGFVIGRFYSEEEMFQPRREVIISESAFIKPDCLFIINNTIYEFSTELNLANPQNIKRYNQEAILNIIKLLQKKKS